jgi:hypothetical protein
MWAILVDQHARIIVTIEGVAADMMAAIDHQDPVAALRRQAFCKYRSGKSGTNDQDIV